MGVMFLNQKDKTIMMRESSSTKVERKVVEKNRRNRMKTLYANLNSLLPSQSSKEGSSLPDQIDDAIKYIKSLEANLKISKEMKESLLASSSKKRSYSCTNSYEHQTKVRAPQLEVKEAGSALEIALITGMDNQSIFFDIIRILQEEGVEVVNANYSVNGHSIMHVVHSQMNESSLGHATFQVTQRLNKLIHGSTCDMLLDPEFWDELETWEV